MRFYVDGVMKGSLNVTGQIAAQDQDLFIGSKIGHDNFMGDLDDVVIYNRALKPEEVAGLAEIASTRVSGTFPLFTRRVPAATSDGTPVSFFDVGGRQFFIDSNHSSYGPALFRKTGQGLQ